MDQPTEPSGVTRRRVLIGLAGLGGAVVVGGAGYSLAPGALKRQLGLGPDPFVPDAPEGRVRLETVTSSARGGPVELFTAVPAGYGDGAGLPVVVVLHGASATAADFRDLGLARFVTAAVRAGAEPFVLAGADGGVLQWEPNAGDDPQAMVADELPGWLADRGFDSHRRALWGWSMGGYGVLRLAEEHPGWARAVAAFSPAITQGDAVFEHVDALAGQVVGLWCGEDDGFYDATRDLVDALPSEPRVATYGEGNHGWVYWGDHTLEAFGFLARHLAR